jgi:hypothetical protein
MRLKTASCSLSKPRLFCHSINNEVLPDSEAITINSSSFSSWTIKSGLAGISQLLHDGNVHQPFRSGLSYFLPWLDSQTEEWAASDPAFAERLALRDTRARHFHLLGPAERRAARARAALAASGEAAALTSLDSDVTGARRACDGLLAHIRSLSGPDADLPAGVSPDSERLRAAQAKLASAQARLSAAEAALESAVAGSAGLAELREAEEALAALERRLGAGRSER